MNSDINDQIPPTASALVERLELLGAKLEILQDQLKTLMTDRSRMENKIFDAQHRIQKILNKLPASGDTRQMNLLDLPTSEVPNEQ